MSERIAYTGGTVLTLDDAGTVLDADLLVEGGRIAAVGGPFEVEERVDCAGALVLPGFVQGHVHLCQALFRGLAEEVDLLEWLERKIWPLEAAHTLESLAASTRLGLLEALASGVTTLLDMGDLRHPEAIPEAVVASGQRAVVAKLLMDEANGAPEALREPSGEGLAALERLHDRYHGSAGDRIRVAAAPRFVLSCSRELLEAVAGFSKERDAIVHTHLNESRREIETTERRLGGSTVSYFDELGLLNERLVAAHAVWLEENERSLLGERRVHVTHCPTANLKLASGTADVRALLQAGVNVALGSDGLPCNNRLDSFAEMRLAGLLSRWLRGREALGAEEIVRLATRGGARALGWEEEIGSLEVGKRADLAVIDVRGPRGAVLAGTDPYTALVYQASAAQVRHVAVDGRPLWRDGRPTVLEEAAVLDDARRERIALLERAGFPVSS